MGRRKKPTEQRLDLSVAGKVDPPLMQAIKRIMEIDDRTMAYIVREALREYVERRGSKVAA